LPFCTACGSQVLPDAKYCTSCGAKLTGAIGVPFPPPSRFDYEADLKALKRTRLFSVILLAGTVVGIVLTVALFVAGIYAVTVTPSAPPSQASMAQSSFLVFGVSLGVGGIVGTLALILLYTSFRTLARVDQAAFGLPSKLTLLSIIAEPLLLFGLGAIFFAAFGDMSQSLSQPSSVPGAAGSPFSSQNVFGVLAGGALAGIGGILALVGIIGGVVLGLWRLGARYDEGVIKAAAILYVIPFLQLIGAILLLVGTGSAMGKVKAATPPVSGREAA
jgi:hypothetical protein